MARNKKVAAALADTRSKRNTDAVSLPPGQSYAKMEEVLTHRDDSLLNYCASLLHPEEVQSGIPLDIGGWCGSTVIETTEQQFTFGASNVGFAAIQCFGPWNSMSLAAGSVNGDMKECHPSNNAEGAVNAYATTAGSTAATLPPPDTLLTIAPGASFGVKLPAIATDLANARIRLVSAKLTVESLAPSDVAQGRGMIGRDSMFANADAADDYTSFFGEIGNEKVTAPLRGAPPPFVAEYFPQRPEQIQYNNAESTNVLTGGTSTFRSGYTWAEFFATGCTVGQTFSATIVCNWEIASPNIKPETVITSSPEGMAFVNDLRAGAPLEVIAKPRPEKLAEAMASALVPRQPNALQKIWAWMKKAGSGILKALPAVATAGVKFMTSPAGKEISKNLGFTKKAPWQLAAANARSLAQISEERLTARTVAAAAPATGGTKLGYEPAAAGEHK